MLNDHVSEHTQKVVCNQSLGTQIAMLNVQFLLDEQKELIRNLLLPSTNMADRQTDSFFSKI